MAISAMVGQESLDFSVDALGGVLLLRRYAMAGSTKGRERGLNDVCLGRGMGHKKAASVGGL